MNTTRIQATPGRHGHNPHKGMSASPNNRRRRTLILQMDNIDKTLGNPVQGSTPVHGQYLIINRSQYQLMVDRQTSTELYIKYVIQLTTREQMVDSLRVSHVNVDQLSAQTATHYQKLLTNGQTDILIMVDASVKPARENSYARNHPI